MKKNIEAFIQNWISEKNEIPVGDIHVDENFFQAGYIDSLAMFRLLFDIETEFNIEIDQNTLFSSTLTTISGLSNTISQTCHTTK